MNDLVRPGRKRAAGALARLRRSESGVSAVEFALLAPVLVLGALGTADAGLAIYQKMMIEQALRAGAHMAVRGADGTEIRAVLEEVASENFALAGDPESGTDGLTIGVGSYCGCPGDTIVQVSCTAVCESGLAADSYYSLTGTKSFDGVMLPPFTLSGTLDVIAR